MQEELQTTVANQCRRQGRRVALDPYNAVVDEVIKIHAALRIFRIRPDQELPPHEPGQYTILGLWDCSRHVNDQGIVVNAPAWTDRSRVIKRAYSYSSRILDSRNALVDPIRECPLEFYVALVAESPEHPAGLTPRLFALEPGDRLMLGHQPKGSYTLAGIEPKDDVLFVATGTGEAPHNGMIAELLRRGHQGRIASLVCVRRLRDLAYLSTHCELERRYPNYRYLPLTTREDTNLEPSARGYVGKRYPQEYLVSPQLVRSLGRELNPDHLHVFVCGNPQMVGTPRKNPDGTLAWPASRGVLEVLVERGFRIAEHGQTGQVHYEKYW